jgi:hypothetical protein
VKKRGQVGTLTDCSTASMICLNITSTPETLGGTVAFAERLDNEGPKIMVDEGVGVEKGMSCSEPVLIARMFHFRISPGKHTRLP